MFVTVNVLYLKTKLIELIPSISNEINGNTNCLVKIMLISKVISMNIKDYAKDRTHLRD